MSSVSSTNSSTTSSIYGTRNVISGLASGLDTETLIENAVSGYQTKITELEAERTKYEWKQEAYRDIISDMVNFNQKYTSYTSSTNLLSNTFFNSATTVTTSGVSKDLVSATGRSTSDIQLDSVTQLATAARYTGGSSLLNPVSTGDSFQLDGTVQTGTLQGSLTLGYGGKTISLSFNESDVFTSAQEMADAINEKLADETISYTSGNQAAASTVIKAVANDDGTIEFTKVNSKDGNSVWIDYTSGNLKTKLGISTGSSVTSFKFSDSCVEEKSTLDYFAEKGLSVTLDGTTKTIKLSDDQLSEIKKLNNSGSSTTKADAATALIEALQTNIDDAFGTDTNGDSKLTVSNALSGKDGKIALNFSVSDNTSSSFQVTSDAGKAIGIESSLSNYVDTAKTLSQMLGDDLSKYASKKTDEDGNVVVENGKEVLLTDSDGNQLYDLKIGNATIQITADTTLKSIMSEINSNEDAGVTVNYSQTTKRLTFTAAETGSAGKISIEEGTMTAALFGATVDEKGKYLTEEVETKEQATDEAGNLQYDEDGNPVMVTTTTTKTKVTEGQDAKFTATVDGVQVNMTRSSNSIDIDGLTVTLKGTFDEEDGPVTFKVSADADTIVAAIKSMVEDYNTMATAIKDAYSTLPLEKSDGSSYEPLSDDDMADMSDTAIERYEEKAKTGLLFGDSDLQSCYSGLLNAISSTTAGSKIYSQIGLSTSYSDGMTTLTLNETKLREALESDPDSVRDAFTSTTGIMQSLSTVVDRYAATTGATKGILIEKAGSTLAPTSIYSNTWQSSIDDIDDEIDKWEDKLSDKVDYYTTQFTNLETLISELNSQSSMLSSLSSGY